MLIVLFMRLAGPLLIFRWPLLGTLLSQYVFDMFDVVIWDVTGVLPKIDYTSFDKPLDLYQLSIQALVVMSWPRGMARKWALSLFGYRFIGFLAYEFFRKRILFLIFPNLFFVFFLFYLIAVKVKKEYWFENKRSLGWIILVTVIMKLPQEYFLHYAEGSPWQMLKVLMG